MLSAVSAGLALIAPAPGRVAPMQRSGAVSMAQKDSALAAQIAGVAAAVLAVGVQSASAGPFTREDIASLTYLQIKGTGLANTCPIVQPSESGKNSINVGAGAKIDEFCLEPTTFQVRSGGGHCGDPKPGEAGGRAGGGPRHHRPLAQSAPRPGCVPRETQPHHPQPWPGCAVRARVMCCAFL
jgi:hypothetical protein